MNVHVRCLTATAGASAARFSHRRRHDGHCRCQDCAGRRHRHRRGRLPLRRRVLPGGNTWQSGCSQTAKLKLASADVVVAVTIDVTRRTHCAPLLAAVQTEMPSASGCDGRRSHPSPCKHTILQAETQYAEHRISWLCKMRTPADEFLSDYAWTHAGASRA